MGAPEQSLEGWESFWPVEMVEGNLRQRAQEQQTKTVSKHTVHPGPREEPRGAEAMGDAPGGRRVRLHQGGPTCQGESVASL